MPKICRKYQNSGLNRALKSVHLIDLIRLSYVNENPCTVSRNVFRVLKYFPSVNKVQKCFTTLFGICASVFLSNTNNTCRFSKRSYIALTLFSIYNFRSLMLLVTAKVPEKNIAFSYCVYVHEQRERETESSLTFARGNKKRQKSIKDPE